MEASLADLQTMVAASTNHRNSSATSLSTDSDLPSDIASLRSMLREKNEKIASLTAEFDAHRADFRSTIDTLEMASSETERVYEKRVQELLADNEELGSGRGDVEHVAQQLKSLEELVAELEEGLEDARRGEAEARGEVEFLRGEVERGRSELRREREKAAKALKGAGASVDGSDSMPDSRDDEIRGLKAIIHSLSSNPEASPAPNNNAPDTSAELTAMRHEMDALKRERSELQGLIDRKSYREEELEREVSALRLTGGRPLDETTPRRGHADSAASAKTAIRPGSGRNHVGSVPEFPPVPRHHSSGANGMLLPNGVGSGSRPGTSLSFAENFADASEGRPHSLEKPPPPLNVSGRGASMSPPPSFRAPDPPVPKEEVPVVDDGTGMAALTGDGPAPGRQSKAVDMTKWCALCERDGHESVDCPFEEF